MVLCNDWAFIVIGVTEISNTLYYGKIFYLFIYVYVWFRENMKVFLTVGRSHKGVMVLRND